MSAGPRFFRVTDTFGHNSFDPVEMLGGKWFGLIKIEAEDEVWNKKADDLKLVPLPEGEAVEYLAKKVQQPGSSAPRFVLPQSAPDAQPAAATSTPGGKALDPEAVIQPRKIGRGAKAKTEAPTAVATPEQSPEPPAAPAGVPASTDESNPTA